MKTPEPKPTRSWSASSAGSSSSGSTTGAASGWAMASAIRRVLPWDTETHTMTAFMVMLPSLRDRGGCGTSAPTGSTGQRSGT
ncbi:hypothetical protein HS99_0000600 [Kitasatospora aureofaciens]|uniref:Uncharacterized protein n=1 Tax=Kitasatospora aureofaciens TaxID=1894 RepID=A0A1E7NF04_KITAU|nr:hypothetical protein HS99_0000600 [Kitasatospora aureofaciens]